MRIFRTLGSAQWAPALYRSRVRIRRVPLRVVDTPPFVVFFLLLFFFPLLHRYCYWTKLLAMHCCYCRSQSMEFFPRHFNLSLNILCN